VGEVVSGKRADQVKSTKREKCSSSPKREIPKGVEEKKKRVGEGGRRGVSASVCRGEGIAGRVLRKKKERLVKSLHLEGRWLVFK